MRINSGVKTVMSKRMAIIILYLFVTTIIFTENYKFSLGELIYSYNTQTTGISYCGSKSQDRSNKILAQNNKYIVTLDSKILITHERRLTILNKSLNRVIFSTLLDMSITDCVLLTTDVILTGSDDNYNTIRIINLVSNKTTTVARTKKMKDFIKIIVGERDLFLYNSTIPNSQTPQIIRVLDKTDPTRIVNKVMFENENNLSWFGKGFFANGSLYIPTINNDLESGLQEINSRSFTIIQHSNFAGAIYKILKISSTWITYLGYNKYKSNEIFIAEYNLDKNIQTVVKSIY